MRLPRFSLATMMAVVVVVALDIAALRAVQPAIPNPGVVLMVAILEVGMFVGTRRGMSRASWLGFEAFGWAYILAAIAHDRPIWTQARPMYEAYVLGEEDHKSGWRSQYTLSGRLYPTVDRWRLPWPVASWLASTSGYTVERSLRASRRVRNRRPDGRFAGATPCIRRCCNPPASVPPCVSI